MIGANQIVSIARQNIPDAIMRLPIVHTVMVICAVWGAFCIGRSISSALFNKDNDEHDEQNEQNDDLQLKFETEDSTTEINDVDDRCPTTEEIQYNIDPSN